MTRSDSGTENGLLATCQTYLRRNFEDNLAAEKSHVYGTSVQNQVSYMTFYTAQCIVESWSKYSFSHV